MDYFIVISENIFERNYSVVHKVRTPNVGEKGFYRQVVSISAFRRREMERWNNQYVKGRAKATHFKYAIAYFANECSSLTWYIENSKTPTIEVEHEDVWEFYKSVGYNYKLQRWEK